MHKFSNEACAEHLIVPQRTDPLYVYLDKHAYSHNHHVQCRYWEIDPCQPKKDRSKVKPYIVEMVCVTCDPGLAVARGIWRKIRTGRSVPISTQLRSHRLISEHFEDTAKQCDTTTLYHTGLNHMSNHACLLCSLTSCSATGRRVKGGHWHTHMVLEMVMCFPCAAKHDHIGDMRLYQTKRLWSAALTLVCPLVPSIDNSVLCCKRSSPNTQRMLLQTWLAQRTHAASCLTTNLRCSVCQTGCNYACQGDPNRTLLAVHHYGYRELLFQSTNTSTNPSWPC